MLVGQISVYILLLYILLQFKVLFENLNVSGPNCQCDSRGIVPNTQCDALTKQCQCKVSGRLSMYMNCSLF